MESAQANAGIMRGGCPTLNASHEQPIMLACGSGGEVAQTIDANYHKGTGSRAGKEREVVAVNEPTYMSDKKGHNGITEDGTATTLTSQEKERPMVGMNGGDAMTSVVRRLTPLE